jgi:hypothetical protein
MLFPSAAKACHKLLHNAARVVWPGAPDYSPKIDDNPFYWFTEAWILHFVICDLATPHNITNLLLRLVGAH